MINLDESVQELWSVMAVQKLTHISVEVTGSGDSGGVEVMSIKATRNEGGEIGYSDLLEIPATSFVGRTEFNHSTNKWETIPPQATQSNLVDLFADVADSLASRGGANYNNEGCLGNVVADLESYSLTVSIVHGQDEEVGEKDEDGYPETITTYDGEPEECTFTFEPPGLIKLIHEIGKES